MKRTDLYNFIREEIINELTISEASPEELKAKQLTITNASAEIAELNKQISLEKDPKKKSELQAKLVVAKNDLAKAKEIKESDLTEMALEGSGARYTAGPKFEDAKEIYATGLYAELLKAIEEAGEKGLTQKELGSILDKGDGSDLNLTLKNLRTVGVLVNSKIAAKAAAQTAKPEEPKAAEKPEAEEPDEWESGESEDDWENEPEEEETPEEEPEEEETPEEEPAAATKASDELGKYVDDLAKLKEKLKKIMDKYRDASGKIDTSDIEKMKKYKQEVEDIPQQIKVLQAKIDRYSE